MEGRTSDGGVELFHSNNNWEPLEDSNQEEDPEPRCRPGETQASSYVVLPNEIGLKGRSLPEHVFLSSFKVKPV